MNRIARTAVVALLGTTFVVRADDKKGEDPKPAPVEKKETKTAELDKPAPDFTLKDVNGKEVKLSDSKGKIVVLEWFNQGCPYCQYAYGEKGPLRELPERLTKQGVVWLSIDSGASADAEAVKKFMVANKMTTPMLLDADGKVGMLYGAKTTPHCFVIDEKGVLRYRGGLDNAPQGRVTDKEAKVNYVEAAVNELKNGKAVTTKETKSYGCKITYPKA